MEIDDTVSFEQKIKHRLGLLCVPLESEHGCSSQ